MVGMVKNPREWWSQKRKELESTRVPPPPPSPHLPAAFMIPAIVEPLDLKEKQLVEKIAEEKLNRKMKCADEGIKAGARAAAIVAIATAIPT
ncbi:unnamed protein product [Sphagnum compactum]